MPLPQRLWVCMPCPLDSDGCFAPCAVSRRLEDAGVGIGRRVLELCCLREKSSRRETRMLGILNFITSTVWKMLFGNAADSLEKSVEQEDEFMIVEKAPIVNAFISSAPCSWMCE